jgi:hypothetical protein
VVHIINFGSTYFLGWKNMSVNIPTNINQAVWTESEPEKRAKELGKSIADKPQIRDEPSYPSLHFIKFRLWTQPVERVDNFYIYFKQLKILTDINEALFDGSDLADFKNVQKLWDNK